MREKIPYTMAIHCCNHRLALCAEGAAKQVSYLFHTFEPWLISHWAYFHFSPTRWQRLQAFYLRHQAALPNPAALGPLMVPQKAGHTRWMSMIKAIIPLISSLEVLLSFYLFEEPQHDSKASGIGKIMNTFAFLRTLYMYADVISIVNQCAISLQSPSLDFSAAILLVNDCRDRLQVLRDDPESGHWLSKFKAKFWLLFPVFKPSWPSGRIRKPSAKGMDIEEGEQHSDAEAERQVEIAAAKVYDLEPDSALPVVARPRRATAGLSMSKMALADQELMLAEFEAAKAKTKAPKKKAAIAASSAAAISSIAPRTAAAVAMVPVDAASDPEVEMAQQADTLKTLIDQLELETADQVVAEVKDLHTDEERFDASITWHNKTILLPMIDYVLFQIGNRYPQGKIGFIQFVCCICTLK